MQWFLRVAFPVMFWLRIAFAALGGFFGTLQIVCQTIGRLLSQGPKFDEPETVYKIVYWNNWLQSGPSRVEGAVTQALVQLGWLKMHPQVAMVACMDCRFYLQRVIGDARSWAYIIRTPGGAVSRLTFEGLLLAVSTGHIRLVIFTSHRDCAAKGAVYSPEGRQRYPAISRALDQVDSRLTEFVSEVSIQQALTTGKLEVWKASLCEKTQLLEDLDRLA